MVESHSNNVEVVFPPFQSKDEEDFPIVDEEDFSIFDEEETIRFL